MLRRIPGFRSRTPWKMAVASFVYGVVLIFIAVAIINPGGSSQPGKDYPGDKHRAAFNDWYSQVMAAVSASDEAAKAAGEVIQKLADGKASAYEVYPTVKDASLQAGKAWRQLASVQVPKDLSKEHRALLEEGLTALRNCVAARQTAFEDLAKFLDSPKPSLLDSANRNLDRAQAELLRAVAKLVQVRTELGIKD